MSTTQITYLAFIFFVMPSFFAQNKNQQVLISLFVIVSCIGGSILYSIYHDKKGVPKDRID